MSVSWKGCDFEAIWGIMAKYVQGVWYWVSEERSLEVLSVSAKSLYSAEWDNKIFFLVLWKIQQEVQKWICTRFAFMKYFHIELFCHSWDFPDVTSTIIKKPGCPTIGRGRSSRLGSNLGNASCPRQRGRGKQKKVCTFHSWVLVFTNNAVKDKQIRWE